jgi:hypothetical protein
MLDTIIIIAVVLLFAIAIVYTRACEALKRPKGGR